MITDGVYVRIMSDGGCTRHYTQTESNVGHLPPNSCHAYLTPTLALTVLTLTL